MKVIFENDKGERKEQLGLDNSTMEQFATEGYLNIFVKDENEKENVQNIINSSTGYLNHCGVFVDKTKFTKGGSKIKRRRSKRRGSKKRRTTKRRR